MTEEVQQKLGRFWTVRPAPGYLPDILQSNDTIASAILPPWIKPCYRRMQRSPAFHLSVVVTLVAGVGAFIYTSFGSDKGPRTELQELQVSVSAYVCAICLGYHICTMMPETHLKLIKRLFRQFEGYFLIVQFLPPTVLFAYLNVGRGQLVRAVAFIVALSEAGFYPVLLDAMPQTASYNGLLLLPLLLGTFITPFILLWIAGMLYLDSYEGMEATEITIFKIPIRPWLIAADSLGLMALMLLQLLRRYTTMVWKRKERGGLLRFTTIRWPMLIEDEREKKVHSQTLPVRAAGMAGRMTNKAQDDKGEDTSQPLGAKIRVTSSPLNKTSSPPRRKRIPGARRVYRVHPIQQPYCLDNFEDVLFIVAGAAKRVLKALQQQLLKRKLRGRTADQVQVIEIAAGSTSHTPPLERSKTRSVSDDQREVSWDPTAEKRVLVQHPSSSLLVGREPFLATLSLVSIAMAGLLLGLLGASPWLAPWSLLCAVANLLLICRAQPRLLKMLLTSFDFAVMLFSLMEFFIFSCVLFDWDSRAFLVLAVALTIISSLVVQDTVIMAVDRRRHWLVRHLAVLLVLELIAGIYLVFLTPRSPTQASSSNSLLFFFEETLISKLARSPLSLALDSLGTVMVYTGRSLLSLIRSPHLLVSVLSEIAYEIDYVVPPAAAVDGPPAAASKAITEAPSEQEKVIMKGITPIASMTSVFNSKTAEKESTDR